MKRVCAGLASFARMAAFAAGADIPTLVTRPARLIVRQRSAMLLRLDRRFPALHRLYDDREREDYVFALLPPFAASFTDQHLTHFEHISLENPRNAPGHGDALEIRLYEDRVERRPELLTLGLSGKHVNRRFEMRQYEVSAAVGSQIEQRHRLLAQR